MIVNELSVQSRKEGDLFQRGINITTTQAAFYVYFADEVKEWVDPHGQIAPAILPWLYIRIDRKTRNREVRHL